MLGYRIEILVKCFLLALISSFIICSSSQANLRGLRWSHSTKRRQRKENTKTRGHCDIWVCKLCLVWVFGFVVCSWWIIFCQGARDFLHYVWGFTTLKKSSCVRRILFSIYLLLRDKCFNLASLGVFIWGCLSVLSSSIHVHLHI